MINITEEELVKLFDKAIVDVISTLPDHVCGEDSPYNPIRKIIKQLCIEILTKVHQTRTREEIVKEWSKRYEQGLVSLDFAVKSALTEYYLNLENQAGVWRSGECHDKWQPFEDFVKRVHWRHKDTADPAYPAKVLMDYFIDGNTSLKTYEYLDEKASPPHPII